MSKQKFSRIAYMVVIFLGLLVFVLPFGIPIIFAGSVSLALFPLLLKFESWGLTRRKASMLLTSLFAIVVSIPLFFFIVRGMMIVTTHLQKIKFNEKLKDQGMVDFVSDLRHDIVLTVHKYLSKYEFADFLTAEKIDDYMNTVTTFLLNFFQAFAISLPIVALFLIVMVICIYSFLIYATNIRHFFQGIFGFNNELMDKLVRIFISDSRQVYISNIATGAIQSLIVAASGAFFDVGGFFLLFFVTLILSFIPIVGAAPVAIVCAFICFIKGQTSAAIILVVIGTFTGLVDNILRPWLTSFGESEVPSVVAFISVLGGALLMGFPGLFIGLLVGSIAFDTLPIFWKELGKDSSGKNELR